VTTPGDHPFLSPLVRPWLKEGLEFLLLESEERADALRLARSPAPEPARKGPARPEEKKRPRASSPPGRVPASGGNGAPHGGEAASSSSSPFPTPVLPLEEWPEAWLALKRRRPFPPRPLVVWTYPGLGDDLAGVPVPERQQAIVRLLTALGHPGGTHIFWPYALPGDPPLAEGSALPEDVPSLFWSGIALLHPRAILPFGPEARDALRLPRNLAPYVQTRVNGRQIVQMPPVLSLRGDENVFLAPLLRFCQRAGKM
jgi:hypothetical protein